MEFCSQSSVALEKVSERLKHVVMSPLSPLEGLSIHREAPPTVEGLGEARDLSKHRTVFDLDLCEIVQNLVEERMATLENERESGGTMIALQTSTGHDT